ncbi:hypothetical protein [Thioalkalivibrio sp. HK1]|uniref:hypothetical protein n=1 Tax=Thioalkalivibrio sp. HK1 TaxID=1469245 RepID=UPI0012DD4C69|nr:hypothetical protein [Thioalkalivibrio sp. HK1]
MNEIHKNGYIVKFKLPGEDFWRSSPDGLWQSRREMFGRPYMRRLLRSLEDKYGPGVEVKIFESVD